MAIFDKIEIIKIIRINYTSYCSKSPRRNLTNVVRVNGEAVTFT